MKHQERLKKVTVAENKVKTFFDFHIRALVKVDKVTKFQLNGAKEFEEETIDDMDYLSLLNISFVCCIMLTFLIAIKITSATLFSPLIFLGWITLAVPFCYMICNFRIMDMMGNVKLGNQPKQITAKDLWKYSILALAGSGGFILFITLGFLAMSVQA